MKKEMLFLIAILFVMSFAISTPFEGNSIVGLNNKDGNFVIVDKDGNNANLMDTLFANWDDEILADIDGDGVDEVIALRDYSAALHVYDFSNNSLVLKTPAEDIGQFSQQLDWIGLRAFDIDDDGSEEIIMANREHGRFFIVDYKDKTFYVEYIGKGPFNDWEGFDIGKIDGKTVIIGLRLEKTPLYMIPLVNGMIDKDNVVAFGDPIGKNLASDITIFDIDKDGKNEIIVYSNGNIFVGEYKDGYYNVELKQETFYKDVKRLTHGDIMNDGTDRLFLLRDLQPFVYYNYMPDLLVEKVINYNKNLDWVGYGIGNIGYTTAPVVEEIPVAVVPAVKEEPKEEIPVAVVPAVKEEPKEKNYSWIWVLMSIIFLSIVAAPVLYFKFSEGGKDMFNGFKEKFSKKQGNTDTFYEKVDEDINKKNQAKQEKQEPVVEKTAIKKVEVSEKEKDLWPKSKRDDDLFNLKNILKEKNK